MQAAAYLKAYPIFNEAAFTSRFIKHHQIVDLINKLPEAFEKTVVGKSFENRDLYLVKWGTGPVRIFLWSQMHGDESTGTMALFDLFNFLQQPQFEEVNELLSLKCTLYFMPMVNPDGAERFTRRNAQQIDINRDFFRAVTPEAGVLKAVRDQIDPHFGFNLHDQSDLWSVKKTGKPATLSYLAPAFDEALHINKTRKKAMLVIAGIYQTLHPYLPQQIGLFDDEYEARAFGDNFQLAGTSTILIEAGGQFLDEEKQEIRKYYFLSIFSGLHAIATGDYQSHDLQRYFDIPSNNKEIFHILIKDLVYMGTAMSIGISYEEEPTPGGQATEKCYIIKDIGDLNHLGAYHVFQEEGLDIEGELVIYKPADFILKHGDKIILAFKNGLLQSKV